MTKWEEFKILITKIEVVEVLYGIHHDNWAQVGQALKVRVRCFHLKCLEV